MLGKILIIISVLSSVFPFVAGFFYKSKLCKPLKFLFYFLIFNVVTEIVAYIYGIFKMHNLYLFHIHCAVELIFFLIICAKYYNKAWLTKTLWIFGISYLAFAALDSFYLEGLDTVNFFTRGVAGLAMLALSLYFFLQIFHLDESIKLTSYPYFWLFSGWLFYFSGTFFMFTIRDIEGWNYTFPYIHSVLNIFLNGMYVYVFWLAAKQFKKVKAGIKNEL